MTRYIYAAIAQHNNTPAGHVCYGRTKDEAYARARQHTTMPVRVQRERLTPEGYDRLVALGKIPSAS